MLWRKKSEEQGELGGRARGNIFYIGQPGATWMKRRGLVKLWKKECSGQKRERPQARKSLVGLGKRKACVPEAWWLRGKLQEVTPSGRWVPVRIVSWWIVWILFQWRLLNRDYRSDLSFLILWLLGKRMNWLEGLSAKLDILGSYCFLSAGKRWRGFVSETESASSEKYQGLGYFGCTDDRICWCVYMWGMRELGFSLGQLGVKWSRFLRCKQWIRKSCYVCEGWWWQ